MATIRIRTASSHDPKSVWILPKLSDINTKLNSATDLPKNAQITGAKVIINADYDGGTSLSQVYIKCGFGYTGTLNVTLLGETRIKQNAADYSATIDLRYFSSLVSNFAFNTADYGSYLAINIYTANNLVSKFNLNYVDLEITYTIPTYTITWANIDGNGKTTTTTVNRGTVPTYSGTPTKASTAQYTYAFSGWSPSPVAATGNATYTAQFTATARKYTVTWKNYDGTVLETDNNVEYGAIPTYNGATPTKASTAQHSYAFSGWSPALSVVTGNATYTAQFTATVRKYTVKWYNYDDTLLETDTDVPYGTKPTYNGETPTKPSDDYYNYGFAGWSPSVDETIVSDMDFTAQFAQTDRYYTVRWLNASAEAGVEGELLETDEVLFNTQPDYNGTEPVHPLQDTDPEFDYTFIGWAVNVNDPAKPDTELETVKGNITYTAIYQKTKKLYAITVILFDTQYTEVYEYGTQITIEAPVVTGYQFVKWSDGNTQNPRKITVIGVATYQATYERIPIPIKVNLEQAKEVYIVPTTQTIVYVIDGTIPTVEIDEFEIDTVNGWNFIVLNSAPDNGYALQKLFITDKNGITTRVY